MSDSRIYDSDIDIIAQDGDTNPSALQPGVCASAINRVLRGGVNRTRPPFSQLTLVSATEIADYAAELELLNITGAIDYQAVKPGSQDGIVVAAGGNIYFVAIVGDLGFVYKLFEGRNPYLLHTWFVQAEDRVYCQNGQEFPLAWDGTLVNPFYEINPFFQKMPVGTIMAYAHGRVFVSDKFNQIFASDIIYGRGGTDTSNTENFTETLYWAEGGSFTTPANLGNITGMKVMSASGYNERGQGELVVLCEKGAYTLNASIPRALWAEESIQRVSMVGRGCVSPWAVTNVNNDLWYRSTDGWAFYANGVNEFQRNFAYRKLSREINKWVSSDSRTQQQFASSVFFDNRIICTVSPFQSPFSDETKGSHRAHKAMAVLDLDPGSSAGSDQSLNFRWNGLWTGIRPIQFVKAYVNQQERCFAFSYDKDDKNRLYELRTTGINDFGNGITTKIKSMIITRKYDFSGGVRSKFDKKRLNGGEIQISDLKERSGLEVSYRPAQDTCWYGLYGPTEIWCDFCEQIDDNCLFERSQPTYRNIKFQTPSSEDCNDEGKVRESYEFQLKIEMEGSYTVNRFRISAAQAEIPESPAAKCEDDDPANCKKIDCCPTNEMEYYLIVNG